VLAWPLRSNSPRASKLAPKIDWFRNVVRNVVILYREPVVPRVIWQDHAPDDILFYIPSVYYKFRIDLRKRSVTKSVHADAGVLGKHPTQELDSVEDVHEIEAFSIEMGEPMC
jgi:hypothetical protein